MCDVSKNESLVTVPFLLLQARDEHDWYCFECHSGGDVICCTSCHRVYHLACIEKEELPEDDVKNKFVCNVCKVYLVVLYCIFLFSYFILTFSYFKINFQPLQMCEAADENFKIKRSQLNRLLTFTCARLREKVDHLHN